MEKMQRKLDAQFAKDQVKKMNDKFVISFQ